jgi:lipopolysaccharide export system protein LptA
MTEVAKICFWYLWNKAHIWVVVLGLLVFSLPNGAWSQEGVGGLVITADRLEMDEKMAAATFSGAVVAREGEMVLFADKMEVYYYKKSKVGKVPGGGVKQVLAFGHVILEQSANKGRADRAEYIVGQRKLTLIGKKKIASIVHAGDKLSGKRILLVLGGDGSIKKVSVLGGGRQRVSASIMPSGSKQKDEKTKKQADKNVGIKKPGEPLANSGRKSAKIPVGSDPELKSSNRVSKSLPQLKQLYNSTSSPSGNITPLIPPKLRVD